MIEVVRTIPDPERLTRWLEEQVKPSLRQDKSYSAKGRLQAWLGIEPTFTRDWDELPGLPVEDIVLDDLRTEIGFDFDFCLITHSGFGQIGYGITPHMDATYADFEAYGLNLTGSAKFSYWCGRKAFGDSPFETFLTPKKDPPTHELVLKPGDLVRFNCKNFHAAKPTPQRWLASFWKRSRPLPPPPHPTLDLGF